MRNNTLLFIIAILALAFPVPGIAQLHPIGSICPMVIPEMSLLNRDGEIDLITFLDLAEEQKAREKEYLSYLRAHAFLSEESTLSVFHVYELKMTQTNINKDALQGYRFLTRLQKKYNHRGEPSEDLYVVDGHGKLLAKNKFLGPGSFKPIDMYIAELFYKGSIHFAFYAVEDGELRKDRIICVKGNELFVIIATPDGVENMDWEDYLTRSGSLFWPPHADIPSTIMAGQ